jgi:hypothetical protein
MRKRMIITGLAAAAALAAGGGTASFASSQAHGAPAPAVSQAQAERTALAHVPGGKISESELGSPNGTQVWEVEVTGADGTEHAFDVDATSGALSNSAADTAADDQQSPSAQSAQQAQPLQQGTPGDQQEQGNDSGNPGEPEDG